MKIATEFFGSIEFDPQSIITFPRGLPGFEQVRRFVCVEQAGSRPLVYLQSLDEPWLCFPTLPARIIEPSYEVEIAPDEARTLELENKDSIPETTLLCLAILNTGNPSGPTANLLSPIAVNVERRIGLQVMQQHSEYDLRHPLLIASECEAVCS